MIDANDVGTPAAVVDAAYRILSGRSGEPRDWEGLAALCLPGARFFPVSAGDDVTIDAFDIDQLRAEPNTDVGRCRLLL